jgi:hypothetical protein
MVLVGAVVLDFLRGVGCFLDRPPMPSLSLSLNVIISVLVSCLVCGCCFVVADVWLMFGWWWWRWWW